MRISPVKIGRTDNPEKRLNSIQTGYPRKLQILGILETDNSVAEEHRLHLYFENSRLHGEWFDIDGSLAIQELNAGFSETFREIQDPMELSRILTNRRKALGLSQKDLASLCGTSRKWINDLETGKETIQLNMVLKVVSTLGLKFEISPKY